MSIRILLGTRGSELALAQTAMVRLALERVDPGAEIGHSVIQTTGDLRPDLRLSGREAGLDKGVWVRELESALAEGRVQAAVHSAKDVPVDLPDGFRLAACLPRGALNDVLISKHPGALDGLPPGAVVATSSLRRQRQLRWNHPHLRSVEIRGNVPTRLRKLAESSDLDALILARAGIDRLGLSPAALETTDLAPDLFLPAPAQGIIAIEVTGSDPVRDAMLAAINDAPSFRALTAERATLQFLGAGCSTPIGIYTRCPPGENERLLMRAILFDEGRADRPPATAAIDGPAADPVECGRRLATGLRRAQRDG